MSGYCEAHRRKFVGEGCPWCRDAGGRIEPAVNTKPAANKPVANTSSYQRYRYRDVEKRKAYMRDYMRTKRAAP